MLLERSFMSREAALGPGSTLWPWRSHFFVGLDGRQRKEVLCAKKMIQTSLDLGFSGFF